MTTDKAIKQFEKLMLGTQERIMSDVIRRIKENGEITRSADWQISRLHTLSASDKAVKDEIKHTLKLSDEQINELYMNAANEAYIYSKPLYEATGKDMIPPNENPFIRQISDAFILQTQNEMQNLTGSLGFAVKENGKTVFKPIATYYQQTLDKAVFDISSGAFDYNTVLKRTVNELVNSGLRTVDYSTGYHSRIDVAARRAVLTGLNQLTGKIHDRNAEELGTDKFEVTRHGTARPTHRTWQGKVYGKAELVTVCGLGAVDGLKGANCRHDYFPFIEGVSKRAYTDEELAMLDAEDDKPRMFGGKSYTAYEATQRQRQLETRMRAQRQKIKLLTEGGADEEDILAAKCRYGKLSEEYTDFSRANGLPQQRERIYIDGLKI